MARAHRLRPPAERSTRHRVPPPAPSPREACGVCGRQDLRRFKGAGPRKMQRVVNSPKGANFLALCPAVPPWVVNSPTGAIFCRFQNGGGRGSFTRLRVSFTRPRALLALEKTEKIWWHAVPPWVVNSPTGAIFCRFQNGGGRGPFTRLRVSFSQPRALLALEKTEKIWWQRPTVHGLERFVTQSIP